MEVQCMASRNYSHNKEVLLSLEQGDLVEFVRGLYSHWGVFIVDEDIVHLAGEEDDGIDGGFQAQHFFSVSGRNFNKAQVCKDNYWSIVQQDKAHKGNKDERWKPLPPHLIVRNALKRMGVVGYNVITQNCEHFANFCRYGEHKSDQVDNVMTGIAVGAAIAGTAMAVYAVVKNWGNSENEEEKSRNKQKRLQY